MSGKLYIVATPIGNLEDITLRAIRILKEVDVILAEDTRHTLKLLNHLQIKKPLISFYKENENIKSDYAISKLEKGENIALVSDAGTPGISDPGEIIIKQCIQKEIPVVPIPGACAFINALIVSGMSTQEFIFIGFLPVETNKKQKKLEEIKQETRTIILYEAPHRILKTLETLKEILGDRQIVVAKELTKLHEQFIRGKISEIQKQENIVKGEFVFIIEGAKENKEQKIKRELTEKTLEEHYQYYEEQGYTKKEIIKKMKFINILFR